MTRNRAGQPAIGMEAESCRVEEYLRAAQKNVVAALRKFERTPFAEAGWSSSLGSGVGLTVEAGTLIERGGVNFSRVGGPQLPPSATVDRPELKGLPYAAAGVSLVLHPRNPHAPAVHMNLRFFRAGMVERGTAWWFGGGMDLTPNYGYEEDCRHFHSACRSALDGYGKNLYPDFKRRCDEYFRIRHRAEQRGIGGVFFDDFNEGGFARAFAVARALGDAFLPAYMPILTRRMDAPYGARERGHQLLRRGRYVEFNLVYDRGTLFGLQSGGRADAILMSLPPLCGWTAGTEPEEGSPEDRLVKEFLQPRDWV